jgi:hypothetical protein
VAIKNEAAPERTDVWSIVRGPLDEQDCALAAVEGVDRRRSNQRSDMASMTAHITKNR